MRTFTFQDQRLTRSGVGGAPVQSLTPQFLFTGTLQPRVVDVEDTASMEVVQIESEITTSQNPDVRVNDILLNLQTGIKYRVVKAFKYDGPIQLVLWVITSEQT